MTNNEADNILNAYQRGHRQGYIDAARAAHGFLIAAHSQGLDLQRCIDVLPEYLTHLRAEAPPNPAELELNAIAVPRATIIRAVQQPHPEQT